MADSTSRNGAGAFGSPHAPSLRAGSQNHRIVTYLADGRWHRSDDIHRAVFCILHSRVAEINEKPGYLIEHRGSGAGADQHFYRLVQTPETAARAVVERAAVVSDAWATRPDNERVAGSGPVPVSVAASDLQLELLEAA